MEKMESNVTTVFYRYVQIHKEKYHIKQLLNKMSFQVQLNGRNNCFFFYDRNKIQVFL